MLGGKQLSEVHPCQSFSSDRWTVLQSLARRGKSALVAVWIFWKVAQLTKSIDASFSEEVCVKAWSWVPPWDWPNGLVHAFLQVPLAPTAVVRVGQDIVLLALIVPAWPVRFDTGPSLPFSHFFSSLGLTFIIVCLTRSSQSWNNPLHATDAEWLSVRLFLLAQLEPFFLTSEEEMTDHTNLAKVVRLSA